MKIALRFRSSTTVLILSLTVILEKTGNVMSATT